MTDEMARLWQFLVTLLFFILIFQLSKYLYWEFTLRRKKQRMRNRLKSERLYPIFQKEPEIEFNVFYDGRMKATIENKESFFIQGVRLTVAIDEMDVSITQKAPPGTIEFPVDIDISPGTHSLRAELRYTHNFQWYCKRLAREIHIQAPEEELFHETSIRDLKKEYRDLAKKYHPDLAENEEERAYFESQMEKINEEYSRRLERMKNLQ